MNKLFKYLQKIFQTEPWRTSEGVEIKVSDTGKLSIDPVEVVKTKSFQRQVELVKKLREGE